MEAVQYPAEPEPGKGDDEICDSDHIEVVEDFPRLDILKEMTHACMEQCRWKSETTYDTVGADIGDNFVEGYSKQGHTILDFLKACTLDELGPA